MTAFGLVTSRHLGRKPKPDEPPEFYGNLISIRLLPTTTKLFEKLMLKTTRKHVVKRNLLNARQFAFRADHSTMLECMTVADHVILNFSNNMSMAHVFLDIEKTFDTTLSSGLLYK
jgi:hypothetical protein